MHFPCSLCIALLWNGYNNSVATLLAWCSFMHVHLKQVSGSVACTRTLPSNLLQDLDHKLGQKRKSGNGHTRPSYEDTNVLLVFTLEEGE